MEKARRHALWVGVLVMAVVMLAFLPAASLPFSVIDDYRYLRETPAIDVLSWRNVVDIWTKPLHDLYVPLPYTIWAILKAAFPAPVLGPSDFGVDPIVLHAVSLSLHAGNAFLAYALLDGLGYSIGAALVGALIFAWHPLQVEAFAWVSNLRDLLSAFFGFLTLIALVKARDGERKGVWALSLGFFFLALSSKPQAVALVAFWLAYRIAWRGDGARAVVKGIMPHALLAGAYAFISFKAQSVVGNAALAVPWWDRPVVALDALAFYAGKLILPLRLEPLYERNPAFVLSDPMTTWRVGALLLGCACVAWPLGWKKATAFALAFTSWLAPVLGFVPFLHQAFSTTADRYAYMSVFVLGLLVADISHAKRWGRLPAGAVLAILLTLVTVSRAQVGKWSNPKRLVAERLRDSADSCVGNVTMGGSHFREGRHGAAVSYLRNARIHCPHEWQRQAIERMLITSYRALGNVDDAVATFMISSLARASDADVRQVAKDLFGMPLPVRIARAMAPGPRR